MELREGREVVELEDVMVSTDVVEEGTKEGVHSTAVCSLLFWCPLCIE